MVSYCTSHTLVNRHIRSNLERSGKRFGWSEYYINLIYQLLTCGDADASEHAELLEDIKAERARMIQS